MATTRKKSTSSRGKKPSAAQRKSQSKMKKATALAKKIRKPGEAWPKAVKRAYAKV